MKPKIPHMMRYDPPQADYLTAYPGSGVLAIPKGYTVESIYG
jgi:hypothetical protein